MSKTNLMIACDELSDHFSGEARVTAEENEFANFSIFNDPHTPYSTFNFSYDPMDFDRLSTLMDYNTRNNVDKIKACIKECVRRRRHNVLTVPITPSQVHNLDNGHRAFNRESIKKLKKFLYRKESEHRLNVSRQDPLSSIYQVDDSAVPSSTNSTCDLRQMSFSRPEESSSSCSDLASLPDSPSKECFNNRQPIIPNHHIITNHQLITPNHQPIIPNHQPIVPNHHQPSRVAPIRASPQQYQYRGRSTTLPTRGFRGRIRPSRETEV